MLARLYFIAAKVFLGLDKENVLTQLWRILPQTQLLRSIHSVLASVVYALTRLFTHESN